MADAHPSRQPLLFLSHSGRETALAEQLRNAILATPAAQSAGLEVWLDSKHLQPGRPWLDQIADVIRSRATGFAVMIDPGGPRAWVAAEIREGLSQAVKNTNFPFIPILNSDASSTDLPAFASAYHAVRKPIDDPAALQALIGAAIGESGQAGTMAYTDQPFRGLRSMDLDWADKFLGREAEVEALITQMRSNPVVTIVADSGTGKSSLAKAGVGAAWIGGALLENEVEKPSPQNWNVLSFRPLNDPITQMAKAIRDDFAKRYVGTTEQIQIRKTLLSGDPEEVLFLLTTGHPSGDTKTLLILDQAEELFTQTQDAEVRKKFARLLTALVKAGKANARLRVILTIRSDFSDQLRQFPELSDLCGQLVEGENKFSLAGLETKTLKKNILTLLAMADYRDTEDAEALADRVVQDMPQNEGGLALAQFALSETWNKRGTGRLVDSYDLLHGVFGALATTANNLITCDGAVHDNQDRLWPIFARLVRLDPIAFRATRRTAEREEFSELDWNLISEFASPQGGRLLMTTSDTVEISHEQLITQWAKLSGWITNDAGNLRTLNDLTIETAVWVQGRKSRRFLDSKAQRDRYFALLGSRPELLSSQEKEYVQWSQRHARINMVAVATGVTAIVCFMGLSAILFVVSEKNLAAAEAERMRAEAASATALTLFGRTKVQSDPIAAIKLAMAAWPDDPNAPRASWAQVSFTLGRAYGWQKIPDVATTSLKVHSVAFSPDGTRIVSGDNDSTLRLWDAQSGAQIGEALRGHDRIILSVAFSPDGTRIVSGAADNTLRLWDAKSGAQIGEPLRGHNSFVNSVAFSPDGTRVISGGADNTLRLWDAQSGAQIGEALKGHERWVNSVVFSSDGRRIVSAGFDGALRLWDAQSGAQIGEPLIGHNDEVISAAFSLDGTRIVSGGADNTLRLWDAESGAQIGKAVILHEQPVYRLAFSSDGTRIVGAGFDGALRLWDAQSGAQIGETLRGHQGEVRSIALSPDSTRIVSGGADRTLRLWDAPSGAQIGEALKGHQSEVWSIALSPDSTRIVSGGADGTLRLWDAQSGAQIGEPLNGHEGTVFGVAFSPDGTRIVSGGADNTLRLWDAESGAQIGNALRGHEEWVRSVAFSPDGTRIVSSDNNGKLRLWDAQSGAQIGEALSGHEGRVFSVTFSSDSARIVSGSGDGTLRQWDAQSGAQIGEAMRGHERRVNSVAFSSDGTRIVSGGNDSTLRLWDAQSGAQIGAAMNGHEDWVYSVAFSPDGSRIVSGGDDSTLRLWDAKSGAQIGKALSGHKRSVRSVAFSRDGRRIVSGSDDSTLRRWDIDIADGSIFKLACEKLPFIEGKRDLDPAKIAADLDAELKLSLPESCEEYNPPLPQGWDKVGTSD